MDSSPGEGGAACWHDAFTNPDYAAVVGVYDNYQFCRHRADVHVHKGIIWILLGLALGLLRKR